jgi:osomolarity two-component system sensor histidine kinase TcsA
MLMLSSEQMCCANVQLRYRKDGSRFWANVIMNAVYSNGVHVGFGKVTRDLTERKAAETRIIAAYDESAKLKSEFLANMSHEIRTPMHGMLSANALLLDTSLSSEQRDLAEIIEESGQVLVQVINDILDYSKLAAGAFSIGTDSVDIAHINRSIARGFQPTLKPGVKFELDLPPDLPSVVKGDPLRYRQVVQNLVNNAGKFTEKGSVSLQASIIKETDDEFTILTEVLDTGIGIDESAREYLFTPFTQCDNTTTKRYKGTGLGLSISKSLTELMGGQIEFAPNKVGEGSHFWFTVKMQKIPAPLSTAGPQILDLEVQMSANHISTSTPALAIIDPVDRLKDAAKSKRLLLAEDNIINQRVMLKVLKAFGFVDIDTVGDGIEAVRLVTASSGSRSSDSSKSNIPPLTKLYSDETVRSVSISATNPDPRSDPPERTHGSNTTQPYDLILMDINMPHMDGFGATKAIRENGILTPIVAMTANALRGDREECIEKGMNDYISKPVERTELVKVLSRWLVESTSVSTSIDGGGSANASVNGGEEFPNGVLVL